MSRTHKMFSTKEQELTMIELKLLRLLFNILKVYRIGSKKKNLTEKITQKKIF